LDPPLAEFRNAGARIIEQPLESESRIPGTSQIGHLQLGVSRLQTLVQQVLDAGVQLVQLREHFLLPLLQFVQQAALVFEIGHGRTPIRQARVVERWGGYGHNHRPQNPEVMNRRHKVTAAPVAQSWQARNGVKLVKA